jgi:single-stranded-DNA-specific exonuclease
MKDNWVVRKENKRLRDKISKSLDISPITAQLLVNRGYEGEQEAELFLRSTLFDLPSPFLLKDMEKAIERIKRAIYKREKIAIYGDYDVDGVTSTALLYSFLSGIGANVIYYNPERLSEGYGVNFPAVEKLARLGVTLIISGDCGITAVREIERAKNIGVDFIVTDHHHPPSVLPPAEAILNPLQPGCSYPGKEMAGVGVVFNLAIGVRRALRDAGFFKGKEPNLGDMLDLVALGTVADCAPLTGVNRIFVKEGIARMEKPKRCGLIALKEVSGLGGEVKALDLGFRLGPRVNASGRLASAKAAVELLVTDDLEHARSLADVLNRENSRRQQIEGEILGEAVSMLKADPKLLSGPCIVLASRSWHPGAIGIVASRLLEMYRKPVVLIAVDEEGVGKGSARSMEGVDIYELLSRGGELFMHFGGHELAAGFSIREEDIETLRLTLSGEDKESYPAYESKITIDCEIDLEDMNEALASEISLLEPFGIGNPEPVFLSRGVTVASTRVLNDRHLSLFLRKGERSFGSIWFNFSEIPPAGATVEMVYTPEFRMWNGKRELRLRVIDVSLSV